MTPEQWNEYKKRSRDWNVRIGYELLHSNAYASLKYGPTIKLLCFMYEKIRVEKIHARRGKARFQLIDDGRFSFTYKEANYRKLSDQQFRQALKELHRVGFLEVHRSGSSLRGDFSLYSLSDRWRLFGQPNFEEKEFPISPHRIDSGFQHGNKFLKKRKRHGL